MLGDTHIISLEYNKQIELGSSTVEPLINDHQQKTTPILRLYFYFLFLNLSFISMQMNLYQGPSLLRALSLNCHTS